MRQTKTATRPTPPYTAAVALSLFLTGCATRAPLEPPPPVEEPSAVTAPPETVAPPVAQTNMVEEAAEAQEVEESPEEITTLEIRATGVGFLKTADETTFREERVEAEGFGLPSPTAANSEQKRLTALEAAQYRALASLAESMHGINVEREARTVDMKFAGEEVFVNINGTLNDVEVVSRSYDAENEIATVKISAPIEREVPLSAEARALNLEQRRIQAEEAARLNATAALREKIGAIHVEQSVKIEDFELSRQRAESRVEGLLTGARYGEANWTSPTTCEVEAFLELPAAEAAEPLEDDAKEKEGQW